MAEEIAVENRISNSEGLVNLTLTLNRVILHTTVSIHQTSPLVRGSKHPITAYYLLYLSTSIG